MKQRYVSWQDNEMWLDYPEQHPDYWTQGEGGEELRANLVDIYGGLDPSGGKVPRVRRAVK